MRIAQDHRPEILKTAARLFAEKSYHEVLMDDVAAAVGVAKGTIYRFYPNKEELYAAICLGWMESLAEQLSAEAERPTLDVEERLERLVLRIAEHFMQHHDFFQVMLRGEGQACLVKNPKFPKRREAIREQLVKVIRQGQREGRFRPGDSILLAELVLGMIRGILRFNLNPPPPVEVMRMVVGVFLHGLSETEASLAGVETGTDDAAKAGRARPRLTRPGHGRNGA